jgi:hypothetical protein
VNSVFRNEKLELVNADCNRGHFVVKYKWGTSRATQWPDAGLAVSGREGTATLEVWMEAAFEMGGACRRIQSSPRRFRMESFGMYESACEMLDVARRIVP